MSWKSRTWLDSWEIKFRDPDEPEWVLTNLRDRWRCRHDCGVNGFEEYTEGRECYHCGATPPKSLVGLEAMMMRWSEE